MRTPDLDRYIIGVRTTARMLIDNRDRMTRHERELRAAARAAGHDIDTRIQYAEGSAAAYSVAGAILAGAIGAASIEELAGTDWTPAREPLPPMLPDDASQVAPDDTIAQATIRAYIDTTVACSECGCAKHRTTCRECGHRWLGWPEGTIFDETRPEPRP